ncbi:MAG: threonine/serine exporter family protein [Clostridia bacterium]|nr:threonine/serine exporter family protein [Clostridia bacterium]
MSYPGENTVSVQEMEALQLAAQLIMENGGETFRAEETVRRMGEGFGLQQVESFAVPSGLFISYRTEEGRLETSVRRVHHRRTNLTMVDSVNQISRETAAGKLSPKEALVRLRTVSDLQKKGTGLRMLPAAAICAGGFTFLFQGGWTEALLSMGIAALVQGTGMLLARIHDPGIASNIVGGLLTALLPALAAGWIPGLITEAVVAGALMPLVPGVAMTNAVQDTLRGDMVSGLSHGTSALMTACLIAGGALLAPPLIRLIQGGGL